MSTQPFLARIIGLPHIPSITEVNVRSGPGTNKDMVFKSPVGTDNLQVLEVMPDDEERGMAGKTYQWFRLVFPNRQTGFVRDDLIEVRGDGTASGYGIVSTSMVAFNLVRQEFIQHGQETLAVGVRTTASVPVTRVTTTSTIPVVVVPPTSTTTTEAVAPINIETDDGPGTVIAMGKTGVNVRPGAGTHHNPPVFRLPFRAEATILDAKPSETTGDPFQWIKISYQGKEGWMREDFARLKGDFEAFGVGFGDQYPNPTVDSWWIRDFNLDPNFTIVHHGWDHAGNIGEPILAGPLGGLVIKVAFCAQCGTSGASAVDRGFQLSSSSVLQNAGWNFGYGHYVIVRYLHDQLPISTQQKLAQQGKAGSHIFVMHAHLQKMSVQEGQSLQPLQEIGQMGNSGNSSGPHLHLEVRAHSNANEINWATMRGGLISPVILFKR